VKIALPYAVASALCLLALGPGCGDSGRSPTWPYISAVIIQPNCATGSCHSDAAAVAGLDFSTPDKGYSSLTRLWTWIVDRTRAGQPGCGHVGSKVVCEEQFRPLITPYDPNESRLIAVLRGRDAPIMPPDRPLDDADIRLIEKWILDGARQSESPSADASVDSSTDGGDAGKSDGGATDGSGDATGDGPGDAKGERGDAADALDAAGREASGG
jgi:hypothetical protein